MYSDLKDSFNPAVFRESSVKAEGYLKKKKLTFCEVEIKMLDV